MSAWDWVSESAFDDEWWVKMTSEWAKRRQEEEGKEEEEDAAGEPQKVRTPHKDVGKKQQYLYYTSTKVMVGHALLRQYRCFDRQDMKKSEKCSGM